MWTESKIADAVLFMVVYGVALLILFFIGIASQLFGWFRK